MKKLIFIFLISACTPAYTPTAVDIENGDYGQFKQLTREDIVAFLKTESFFDPNSAQVEDCSKEGEKGWTRDKHIPSRIIYGYWSYCDLNVKNRMGGYGGFKRVRFLSKDGEIVGSENLNSAMNPHRPSLINNPNIINNIFK